VNPTICFGKLPKANPNDADMMRVFFSTQQAKE